MDMDSEAQGLPSELANLCLAQLGLPFLLFDSRETLVYANNAAQRQLPACSSQLHSTAVFGESATDLLGFETASIVRTAPQSTFSLARIFGGNSISPGEKAMNDVSSQPQQPYLTLVETEDARTWWQSSISLLRITSGSYYAVLLVHSIEKPEHKRIIPPEKVSAVASLQRLPLARKFSEPPKGPSTLQECVDEDTLHNDGVLSASFYKTAVECMPQILFTSAKDGIVTYLNPQWYAYTGWQPNDDSNTQRWADVFHPNDVEHAVRTYGASVRTGADIQLQYRVKGRDGNYRWMIARGRPVKDQDSRVTGFVTTLTDGQELINARQEAVQARRVISTVLKASAIALIVIDTQRRITVCEGYLMYADCLDVKAEEPLGQLLEHVWPDAECIAQVQQIISQRNESSRSPIERDFATTVGDRHFRYRLSPLYDTEDGNTSGEFAGLAIVCTDVTAMKQAELALQQSQQERAALVASENAAKEESRLKTVFVTSLSHEIRTPISGMLGISELLLADSSLGTRQRSLVQKQIQAGELLLQLVSMVLDIGKISANKLEIERRPFHLAHLLQDLDIFSSLAEAKRVYFKKEVQGGYAGALVGDRLRLSQILSNFLSNAIKFTSEGGITLAVLCEDTGPDCVLTFKVVDSGIGIDQETLPQLFKPFHQASVSTAREYGGSGLGLTIARSLVELMGGTVMLESTIGVGTVATLQIPLGKAAIPKQAGSPSRPMTRTASLNRAKCSILIAEDNRLLQEVYQALVRKMGFTKVQIADDGQEAVELVDAEDFDIILMDCEMPRLSGPGAVSVIRKHPRQAVRSVKVIALTANAVAGDKERFLALQFDKYLPKPVRASALEAAILECLAIA